MMRRLWSTFSLTGFLLLAACRREKAASVPELPTGAPPPAPADPSRFSAPLAYDFTAVLRIVERAVPRTFGELDSVKMIGNDARRHYAFEAERGPFIAYADGKLVHLRATLSYAARGYYKPVIGPTISGGCGDGKKEDRPRITVELATPLSLTANWHLASRASLVTVAPASTEQRDRCDVTILHYDVTDRVMEAAKSGITSHLRDIDAKVAEVDLREKFSELWRLLSRPIQITDGVWLMLYPRRLAIGNATGKGHVLTIPVTLEARPEIVTSVTEPAVVATTLPALERQADSSGFHILIDGEIDYGAASAAVERALVGKIVTKAGQTVSVTRASLAPSSKGQLSLAVTFNGDAAGSLRFVGTPVFDSVRHEISLPDLDYDLSTDNPLINTFTWLRSDAMRATFREKSHFPVDSLLERGRGLLLSALNRKVGDALTLSATVNSVAVRGLYITRSGIVVRAEATGNAAVAVQQR